MSLALAPTTVLWLRTIRSRKIILCPRRWRRTIAETSLVGDERKPQVSLCVLADVCLQISYPKILSITSAPWISAGRIS
jgi:hypothetical protein